MDAKTLAEETLQALNKLLTLSIVTTVGDVTASYDETKGAVKISGQDLGTAAVTQINIATGDIWSHKPLAGATGHVDIGDYHEQMVEKSQAIMDRNVRLIADMIEKLRTAF